MDRRAREENRCVLSVVNLSIQLLSSFQSFPRRLKFTADARKNMTPSMAIGASNAAKLLKDHSIQLGAAEIRVKYTVTASMTGTWRMPLNACSVANQLPALSTT